MTGLLQVLATVKSAAAVAALTAALGLTGVAGHAPTHPTPDVPAATPAAANPAAILVANQARLLENLHDVLARLESNANVNEHAKAALQKVIDRLGSADHGLLHGASMVASQGASGDHQAPVPPQAADHPTPSDHPSATDHPTGNDHPGRP